MARTQSVYRCTECGHDHPKWVGRCEGCEAWNTVAEEPLVRAAATRGARRTAARPTNAAALPAVRLRDIAESRLVRWPTGLPELDFVLGGGIVPGSMTLIGGEPGIGKSTLLLQVAARLEAGGRRVLYASGEESPDQLRLRAARLEEDAGPVHVLGETRLEAVLEAAAALPAEFLVLDSIQTVYTDSLESAPGNVGQVRESSALLMRYAKETGTAVVVVGHVTKGGGIAGPKTLEHIVDTVLYFEGEGSLDYRLLRATKNRFGSVDELGVFSMTERGLVAVPNPSAMFLAARATGTSGSAVTALMEGHPTRAGGGAGAGRTVGIRHAAAGGHRARPEAARGAARGAGAAREHLVRVARRLRAGHRRGSPGRAGRRPGGGGGAALQPARQGRARGRALPRRDRSRRRGPSHQRDGAADDRGGATRVPPGVRAGPEPAVGVRASPSSAWTTSTSW